MATKIYTKTDSTLNNKNSTQLTDMSGDVIYPVTLIENVAGLDNILYNYESNSSIIASFSQQIKSWTENMTNMKLVSTLTGIITAIVKYERSKDNTLLMDLEDIPKWKANQLYTDFCAIIDNMCNYYAITGITGTDDEAKYVDKFKAIITKQNSSEEERTKFIQRWYEQTNLGTNEWRYPKMSELSSNHILYGPVTELLQNAKVHADANNKPLHALSLSQINNDNVAEILKLIVDVFTKTTVDADLHYNNEALAQLKQDFAKFSYEERETAPGYVQVVRTTDIANDDVIRNVTFALNENNNQLVIDYQSIV